ncbi:hypothetical protein B0G75_109205 [Paraburkholderia sp. BL18I3N2]|nr:hypothetical protein B0G75_109205 [Paraburkholderia sp. BL18I3N2]
MREITIADKKVIDWFTNYLVDNGKDVNGFGWVVTFMGTFNKPRTIRVREGEECQCSAITCAEERVCQQLERYVGISGTGFFNWLD